MTTLEFTIVVWLGSFLAGFLGALTGLGGGVVVVPMLVLMLGVDIRYAIGASLVSVIATSSGAAAAYVREGYSNIRIGMFLEIATTIGAAVGALIAAKVSGGAIGFVFGLVLLYSAFLSRHDPSKHVVNKPPDALATKLRMNSDFPGADGREAYNVYQVPGGFGLMFGAGMLSGLLGIGSGAVKVSGNGSGDEDPLQSLDHNQQFHDWSDRGGECGSLPEPWLYRSAAGDAGNAGSTGRLAGGSESAGASERSRAALCVRDSDRRAGDRDAVQRSDRKIVMDAQASWNDQKIEQIIGVLLRVGVSMSAALVFAAGIAYLWQNHAVRVSYQQFHGETAELTSVAGVVRGAANLDTLALMQLGLLILIATPVARVLFAAFAFALEHDWLYVIVSLIVFGVLLATLTGWVM